MANRSYLYSTNTLPGFGSKNNTRKVIGISEWRYDIPLIYKILLSGNPRICSSIIWESPPDVALSGYYAIGLKRLKDFFRKIIYPSAQQLIVDALDFLTDPDNQNTYFILECAEIFAMGDFPFEKQALCLLEEIKNLQPKIDEALLSLRPKPIGAVAKLFGQKQKSERCDLMERLHALGLGDCWSNSLYFAPGGSAS